MHYAKITAEFTKKVFELCEKAKKIVITAHKSPDEDAIASVLAIYEILNSKYKNIYIRIILTAEKNDRFKIFKNFKKIEFVKDLADEVDENDLLIMLDGSQFYRFTNNVEKLKLVKKIVCIDHHPSPIDEFGLSLVIPTASSTVELIYLLFNDKLQISKELAEIFLLGILGDTGNFTYLNYNQTETLIIAKKLLDISQIIIQDFQAKYRSLPKRVFNIIQELIKNTKYESVDNWPDFQYSFMDNNFKEKNQYSDREISNASHIYMAQYLGAIENYTWGLVITYRSNDGYVISGRSLPKSVSIRELMEKMKLGGGHDRAAGGTFEKTEDSIEKCIKKVTNWMKENKPVIN